MKNLFGFLLISISCVLTACNSKSNAEQLDHVILVINNLEKGMQQFEEMTGVKPVFGGIHPNSFTQNAIVSLGENSYIEIMAPQDDVDSIPDWIRNEEKLYPIGWALSTNNAKSTQNILSEHNISFSESRNSSRETPIGNRLEWSTFRMENTKARRLPFFITWNNTSTHPSINSPKGCSLKSLKLYSTSTLFPSALKKMDIQCEVIESAKDSIILIINSPKGEIIFR